MASGKRALVQFRERLRSERERHGWSQNDVAEMLAKRGVYVYSTTIAKIESGDRNVIIDELVAFSDIFGISVDAFIGRAANNGDLAWAVSRLADNAQKVAGEVDHLSARVKSDIQDVVDCAAASESRAAVGILEDADVALTELARAHDALNALANRFPLVAVTTS